MQPDLLEQLRDIHLPMQPSWWPPAPGWWLLAAALLLGLGFLARHLLLRRRRMGPIRQARQLLDELFQDYQSGRLSPAGFVHASNELLKRLLVHSLQHAEARPASGREWLALLDGYAASNDFSQGPGAVLGDARFQPEPSIDVPALNNVLHGFLQRVNP